MKKRKIALLALFLLIAVSAPLAYQYSSFLRGTFISPVSVSLCPTSASLTKTIYVREGAAGGTGTKLSPYNSIASVQTALETDSTIKRVCVSGDLSGTLDLDGTLGADLTIAAYASGSKLETLHQETGVLSNLTISGLEIQGTMELAPLASLTLRNLDVEDAMELAPSVSLTMERVRANIGPVAGSVLLITSTDTVTIKDSNFIGGDIGIETTPATGSAVGSLTLEAVTFSMTDTALKANYLSSLSVTESSFEYDIYGIESTGSATLSVSKSTFIGGEVGLGIIDSPPAVTTALDFQNNFVIGNTEDGLMNERTSRVNATLSNNSFYDNDLAVGLINPLGTNVYENNVLYANASQAAFGSTTQLVSMTSDYNLFYGAPTGNASTLADWQTATGNDMNSLEGDPLFVSATDLHISAGSPAIDAGTTTAVTDDIDGDARTSGSYDIGADEY